MGNVFVLRVKFAGEVFRTRVVAEMFETLKDVKQ